MKDTVLIFDEDIRNAKGIKEYFAKIGYGVVSKNDLKDTEDALYENIGPEYLVMDPSVMNHTEKEEDHMRKIVGIAHGYNNIPVIFCTAFNEDFWKERCKDRQCAHDRYVQKGPNTAEDLKTALEFYNKRVLHTIYKDNELVKDKLINEARNFGLKISYAVHIDYNQGLFLKMSELTKDLGKSVWNLRNNVGSYDEKFDLDDYFKNCESGIDSASNITTEMNNLMNLGDENFMDIAMYGKPSKVNYFKDHLRESDSLKPFATSIDYIV